MEKQADHLFEVSWEVCNKVGGIYTVVKSKVQPIQEYYGDNYFTIGPYFYDKAKSCFEECDAPHYLKPIFEDLKRDGIHCHFGKWLIPGEPKTILVSYQEFTHKANDIKGELWDKYGIDSLATDFHDFGEPVVWAYAVGILIQKMQDALEGKCAAHFHEWLSGTALLYLHGKNISVGTTFTTHATMLGRTLSSKDVRLYGVLDFIKPEEEAAKNGIVAKYTMERECAKHAGAFTTVSEITGLEAEKLLHKKPDVILPNGLNFSGLPTYDELAEKHSHFKAKIKEFIIPYFFPSYHFDLDETLIYFICGRYEYHDKGIDVFTKALGNMNRKLKEEGSNKTIVAFYWIPVPHHDVRRGLQENKVKYNDVADSLNENFGNIRHNIVNDVFMRKEINSENVFGAHLEKVLHQKLHAFKGGGEDVPLCTHDLQYGEDEQVVKGLREEGLNNAEDDRVKVIIYPIFLTGADGLLDTGYEESMIGAHLGVFPSYYEPWGYTPLEAGSLGTASVTTDLAGFGRFVKPKLRPEHEQPGMWVIDRKDTDEEYVVNELTRIMDHYAHLNKNERIKNKMHARETASLADWKEMVKCYIEAHNLSVSKI